MKRKKATVRLIMSSTHLTVQHSWPGRLKQAQALGVWGVEVFGTDLISGELTQSQQINDLRGIASELGLTLTAHPWFDWSQIEIDEAVLRAKVLLERCQLLGTQLINVHLNFFANVADGCERVSKIVRPLLDIIEVNHQKLCFENVPCYLDNPLGSQPEEFIDFFQLVDNHPNIGLTIDVGHAHVSRNFARFVEKLGDKWWYTHLADNCGKSDDHLGPGMGSVNWDEIIYLATLGAYNGPFVLEFPERFLPASEPTLVSAFNRYGWEWPSVSFGNAVMRGDS